jgi:hypothetical protein
VTIVVTVEGVGVVVVVVRTGNDPVPETSPPQPPAPARDQVAQLKDLADLKAEGIVINAEFRRPKAKILACRSATCRYTRTARPGADTIRVCL